MKNLQDLYVDELRDLASVEDQIIEALPKMAKKAQNKQLKDALKNHLQETKQQRARIDKIFKRLDKGPGRKVCKAMRAIIEEGEHMVEEAEEADVRDATIIAAAQKVEHYEISGYGTLATYAEQLGFSEDHDLLGESLAEEKKADEKLSKIAKSTVNKEAVAA